MLQLVNGLEGFAVKLSFSPVIDLFDTIGKRITRSEKTKPENWHLGLEGDLPILTTLPPVFFDVIKTGNYTGGFMTTGPLKGAGCLRLTPDNPPQLRWTLRLMAGAMGSDDFRRLQCEGIELGGRGSEMGVHGVSDGGLGRPS